MQRLVTRLAYTLITILTPFLSVGQEINGFSYKLIEDKIEITYSLGGEASDRYEVNLFNSLDDFNTPLALVQGDVGIDIVPGTDKTILWDSKRELGDFEGDLSLKLKAKFIPFVIFTIEKGAKIKRAKEQVISWNGNGDTKSVKLELYQGNIKISDIGNSEIGDQFSWAIPKDLELGNNYRIQALGSGRVSVSEPFTITRKIPLILWAVPVVVVGGAMAIIISSSGNGNEENNNIPDPVEPN
jgi:hypothetical protein